MEEEARKGEGARFGGGDEEGEEFVGANGLTAALVSSPACVKLCASVVNDD